MVRPDACTRHARSDSATNHKIAGSSTQAASVSSRQIIRLRMPGLETTYGCRPPGVATAFQALRPTALNPFTPGGSAKD